jgi:hypothetical protein
MLIHNPDLRRYALLELSRYRLLLMAVALILLALINGQRADWAGMGKTMEVFFVLLTLVWGSVRAANAPLDDVRNDTWDVQRMASVSPWTLTWGKWLGAPLFAWYSGAWTLFFCTLSWGLVRPGVTPLESLSLEQHGWRMVWFILCALAAHGASLLFSLLLLRLDMTTLRRKGSVAMATGLGVILGFTLSPYYFSDLDKRNNSSSSDVITWYGVDFTLPAFVMAALMLCLLWLAVGIVAQMRFQLRLRPQAWRWTGFILFAMAYGGGFASRSENGRLVGFENVDSTLGAPFLIGLCCFYSMLALESWSLLRYRRWWETVRHHGLLAQASLEQTPAWLVALLLTAGVAVGTVLSWPVTIPLFVMVFTYLLRDLTILHACSLSSRKQRSRFMGWMVLCILYILLPLAAQSLEIEGLHRLLIPKEDELTEWSQAVIFSNLAQTALALGILRRQMRPLSGER